MSKLISTNHLNGYHLNDGLKYDVLWTGSIGTISITEGGTATINLSSSLEEYFKFGVVFTVSPIGEPTRPQYREFLVEQLKNIINEANPATHLSVCWGYKTYDDYSDILSTSTMETLAFIFRGSLVHKIIGIK